MTLGGIQEKWLGSSLFLTLPAYRALPSRALVITIIRIIRVGSAGKAKIPKCKQQFIKLPSK